VLYALPFPAFDPVLIQVGPLAIRWYALAYIAGILLGWAYVRRLAALPPPTMPRERVDDLVVWLTLGIIVGGRLGYVLFYKPGYYLEHLAEIPAVWQGGMSFHGGMLGVLVAGWLFCRKYDLPVLRVGDAVACAVPIGLFFGRIANFVNGELFGRPTDVPWAVVFPHGGPEPRHPSQLYQAGLEGLLLGLLLFALSRSEAVRSRPGLLGGTFLAGYAVARAIGELFREPDAFLGFLIGGATMGQLLSLPMLALGLYLVARALRRP